MRAHPSAFVARRESTGFLRRHLRGVCGLVLAIELLATVALACADRPSMDPVHAVHADGQTYYLISPAPK